MYDNVFPTTYERRINDQDWCSMKHIIYFSLPLGKLQVGCVINTTYRNCANYNMTIPGVKYLKIDGRHCLSLHYTKFDILYTQRLDMFYNTALQSKYILWNTR